MARILIVDDEATNREVQGAICRFDGHSTALAVNGQKALDLLLDGQAFDLVLLDVQMPVMNGVTFARALRADPRFDGLPILGVTGQALAIDRAAMMAAGFNDVLTKPFRRKQLIDAMAPLLSASLLPLGARA